MRESGERNFLFNVLKRIGLWFISLLLAVAAFSQVFSLLVAKSALMGPIFHVTTLFALPVGCLCLPFVIAIKHLEERGIWTILLGGSLVGPALLGVWFLVLVLRGADLESTWNGDPLAGVGGISCMFFSWIVGFLTMSFYVAALKVLHRRSSGSQPSSN